jgi:hypothetical protein
VLAPVLALTPSKLRLHNKRTTVNGVDNSVTRAESEMRPSARVPNSLSATRKVVVLREDIEESDLFDLAAVGVLGNGAHIKDTETGLVVGLVGETFVDVLVVVNRSNRALVIARVLGLLQVGDVPDVSDREAVPGGRVGSGAVGVELTLVKLVVHNEVSLPHGVENPALVGVGGTDVRSAGDDLSGLGAVLVGRIVDGEGVLVVAVADISAEVLFVRAYREGFKSACCLTRYLGFYSLVTYLCKQYIVRHGCIYTGQVSLVSPTTFQGLFFNLIPILRSTASLVRVVGIVHVDEDGSPSACVVTTSAAATANRSGPATLLIGNDVVRATRNTIGDVHPANVLLDIESLGVPGAQLEEFLHVEELDAVASTFRPHNQSVSDLLDLTPNDAIVAGRETADVFELTLLGNLCESCTVGLANGNEFSAGRLVSPTPATRAFANGVTELCVSLEVVEVLDDLVSLVISKFLVLELTMSLQR